MGSSCASPLVSSRRAWPLQRRCDFSYPRGPSTNPREKGEAEKILVVKAAEADAKSKELSGIGIANQRIAIVNGLKESVEDFQKAIDGVSAKDVMSLVILTQYYDMLTDVGRNSNSNTILIPHSPGAVGDFQQQVLTSLLAADKTGKDTGAKL